MTRPIPVKGKAIKKPVSVEYIQITDETINEIVDTWAVNHVWPVALAIPNSDKTLIILKVDTPDGEVYAQRGDFILKTHGQPEFWVVQESIFHETYNAVHQPTPRTDAYLQDSHASTRRYVPTQGGPVAYDGENLREKKFTGAEPSLEDKLRDLGFEPEPDTESDK